MPHERGQQNRIFWLCWVAYACAYFCRVNLPVALPAIAANCGWGRIALGAVGSSFFWTYAGGQVVNGYLGDRVSSRWLVGIGLGASALINLCFGFARSLPLMIVLWGLNGYFQSMLWGPIMRTLAVWLPDRPLSQTATRITTSTIGGYFLAWGLSGYLVTRWGWSWAFWLPAGAVGTFALVWLALAPTTLPTRETEAAVHAADGSRQPERQPFGLVARTTGLWLLALACVAQGVIKDGIGLWGPSLLWEAAGGSGSTTLVSLLIPTMNLIGIYLSAWISHLSRGRLRSAIAGLLAASGLGAIALAALSGRLIFAALLLPAISCLIFAVNTLLLSVIPLHYQRYGLTSSVAGTLDAASYLGAAGSGLFNGWLADSGGWGRVTLVWGLVGMSAAGLLLASRQQQSGRMSQGPDRGATR